MSATETFLIAPHIKSRKKDYQSVSATGCVEYIRRYKKGYEIIHDKNVIPYFDIEVYRDIPIEKMLEKSIDMFVSTIRKDFLCVTMGEGEILIAHDCRISGDKFKYSAHVLIRGHGSYSSGQSMIKRWVKKTKHLKYAIDMSVYKKRDKQQKFRMVYCGKEGEKTFLTPCIFRKDEIIHLKDISKQKDDFIKKFMVTNTENEELISEPLSEQRLRKYSHKEPLQKPNEPREIPMIGNDTVLDIVGDLLYRIFEESQEVEWEDFRNILWSLKNIGDKYDALDAAKKYALRFSELSEKHNREETLKLFSASHRKDKGYLWRELFRQMKKHNKCEANGKLIDGAYKCVILRERRKQLEKLKEKQSVEEFKFFDVKRMFKEFTPCPRILKEERGDYEFLLKRILEKALRENFKIIINGTRQLYYVKNREYSEEDCNRFIYRWRITDDSNVMETLDKVAFNIKIKKGKENMPVTFASFYKKIRMETDIIRRYNSVLFYPYLHKTPAINAIEKDSFNLFHGFQIMDEIPEEIIDWKETMLSKHFDKYIFAGQHEYINKWIAHMIQKPNELCGVALVLYSESQGVGKDMFSKFISKLIGSEYYLTYQNDPERIFDKFNGEQAGKLFIHLNELPAGNNSSQFRRNHNTFKGLVSANMINIENKYSNKFSVKHKARYLLCTNYRHAIYLEKTDRRTVFVECDSSCVNNVTNGERIRYFSQLFKELNDMNVIHSAFDYYSNLNIEDFNPMVLPKGGQIKKLALTLEQMAHHEKFILGYIVKKMEEEKKEEITIPQREMYKIYDISCENNNEKKKPKRLFDRFLKKIIGEGSKRMLNNEGKKIKFLLCTKDEVRKNMGVVFTSYRECCDNLAEEIAKATEDLF